VNTSRRLCTLTVTARATTTTTAESPVFSWDKKATASSISPWQSFAQHRTYSAMPITIDNINQKVRATQYAVRGAIVLKAQQLEADLKAGAKLPFERILYCNIGNPQSLGQKPISYYRQVLALCDYPDLLEKDGVEKMFPGDVIQRAKDILGNMKGGTGAYSESKGVAYLRQMIADSIAARDGYPADKDDLWLTDGASMGCHYLMKTLIRDENDAILTPIPQYPLYSATITLYGGTLLPYYLQEATGWQLDVAELRSQVASAKASGKTVRALVVINPGNPTGNSLSMENMKDVVTFCAEEGLLLLADEVYQANIYAEGKTFTSFKKVVRDAGFAPDQFPIVSFQSTSKGYYGECGRRGGYMEICGVDPLVKDELYKLASVGLCPNLNGQITMGLVANPPKEGEESYPLFVQEKEAILASLKRRALKLVEGLNALEGVTCQTAQGAMYAFPKLTMPKKFTDLATAEGKAADAMYAMRLLEATGIVVVPGSGFGQVDGTWHFRTTFLPAEEDIDKVVASMTAFHQAFMDEFR